MNKFISFKFLPIILMPVLIISGCSDGALGMKESMAWHHTASTEVKRAYFAEQCEAFGYNEGTAEMNSCIERLWTKSIQKQKEARATESRQSSYSYEETMRNNRIRKLERENRARDTQCIMAGGVPSGGLCL
jgi:hypothetical protein